MSQQSLPSMTFCSNPSACISASLPAERKRVCDNLLTGLLQLMVVVVVVVIVMVMVFVRSKPSSYINHQTRAGAGTP